MHLLTIKGDQVRAGCEPATFYYTTQASIATEPEPDLLQEKRTGINLKSEAMLSCNTA